MTEPATYTGWAGLTSLAIMAFYAILQGVTTLSKRRRNQGQAEATAAEVELRRFRALLDAQHEQIVAWKADYNTLRAELRATEEKIDVLENELSKVREKLADESRQRIWLEETMRRQGGIPRHWPGEKPEGGSP